MRRLAFVMDQQVGLRTHALLVRRVAELDPELDLHFVEVHYDAGKLARLPGSGSAAGVREIRKGLGDVRRFDAVLWATWAAKFVPELVEARPAFLAMDMTPSQMAGMGEHYGYSQRRASFLGSWKRRASERIYRAARHFFPWNSWVAKSLIDEWGVAPSRVTSVSPGVDTRLFQPPTSRNGAGSSCVKILFVGGDFQRKGGDLLLRWARETSLPVEVHLVTRDEIGVVPNNVVVHQGVGALSQELVCLYQSCDLFVLPTRADCYSLVALEAMACGLPVVVTSIGGIPELVVEGENGYLIPPDDYESLNARLNELVARPELRQRLGAAGRRRVVERYDSRSGVQTILEAMKAA